MPITFTWVILQLINLGYHTLLCHIGLYAKDLTSIQSYTDLQACYMYCTSTCNIMHVQIHVHSHIHTHTYTHTLVYIHVCTFSVYVHVWMHTHLHTNLWMHTHTPVDELTVSVRRPSMRFWMKGSLSTALTEGRSRGLCLRHRSINAFRSLL